MCGIIGLIQCRSEQKEAPIKTRRISATLYQGLLSLQHRGQDAAGILGSEVKNNQFCEKKSQGLIKDIFAKEDLQSLKGNMALGHNRYTTVGGADLEDTPPFQRKGPFALPMGIVHNGNLVNYFQLRKELLYKNGKSLLGQNDGEALLALFQNFFSQQLEGTPKSVDQIDFSFLKKVVKNVAERAKGGYAFLIMMKGIGLLAFRDPHGMRPLVMGRKGKECYSFCSESIALDEIGHELVRTVSPGEVVFVSEQGDVFHSLLGERSEHSPAPCMFEWVYFSSHKSQIKGRSVKEKRIIFGKVLGEKIRKARGDHLGIDVICAVPETGQDAAFGTSQVLGLPLFPGILKKGPVGRTFILPEGQRERVLKKKFWVDEKIVKGQSLLLIDDSLVRGATLRELIKDLYRAGAKDLTFAFSCPPIKYGCYYGVDFPDQKELLASGKTVKQMSDHLGVKEFFFLSEKELTEVLEGIPHCFACVNGHYPSSIEDGDLFAKQRQKQKQNVEVIPRTIC
jgi:amidophosphoribosyltransferase